MNNAEWLEYAKNEIKKAEKRMEFVFEDDVSESEAEMMAEIIEVEENYISFLRHGIGQIEGKSQTPDILEILKSRGKKFSRNN